MKYLMSPQQWHLAFQILVVCEVMLATTAHMLTYEI